MKRVFSPFFLSYLRILSKIQLSKFGPLIIGVAGSSGKSSVSLLIGEVLSEKFRVKETLGKNSETGIPLSILGINPKSYNFRNWILISVESFWKVLTNFKKYDIFVAEMGIDSPFPPKNMEYLLRIVEPKIAVLTNISYEHSIYFEELLKDQSQINRDQLILELIAKEEIKIINSLSEKSAAIINIDDENIKKNILTKAKIISVSGKNKKSNYFIKSTSVSLKEFKTVILFEGKEYEIKVGRPLPDFFAYTFALAIAAAVEAGFNIQEAISAIEKKFSLPPGRISIFEGINNSTIIDSSYNSSLEPAVGLLEMLKTIGENSRKVAILGDMREQGDQSKNLHEKLAESILKNSDFAILIGPLMMQFVEPVLEKNKFMYKSFKDFSDAKGYILENVKENDLVLVKGSQNKLLLERVSEMLLRNKEDISFLCRRGKFWDKIRNSTL